MDHRPPGAPVRVGVLRESELVVRGLASMLAGHRERVQLLPPRTVGASASGADLTLHDLFAAAPAGTPAVRTGAHDGALVAWTWDPRPGAAEVALAHGARGLLSKALPAATLVDALERIARGEVVVETGRPLPVDRGRTVETPLTPREADVVSQITRGMDNFSIARESGLSINSVKTYIRSAYQKMGVSSRSQAVLWGVRHGYLDGEPYALAADGELTG